MIGYAYKIVKFSFFVAIIGSITYSYYIRSFLGYYDTDVLNVFLSLNIIAFMILLVEKKDIRYIIPIIISIILFSFWYHSSKLIIAAILSNFIIYIIIWKKKLIFKKKLFLFIILSFFTLLGYFYLNEINSFFLRAHDYIFKVQNIHLLQNNNKELFFKSTLSTINEAKSLPIDKLWKYLGINSWYFYLSSIALFFFYIRFKSFFLTLSLLLISLLSIKAGIRFSEYGVLIIAFGSVYLIYIFKNILTLLSIHRYIINIIFVFSLFFLILNYVRVVVHKNKFFFPIFSSQSINILHKFDKKISNKDFILTWWDYGWPLWYFTKANTLIDNGKHFEDNYIISKLLFSSQDYTAKASRYFMEQCQGRDCYLSRNIFKNNSPKEIENIIQNYQSTEKTKDIYFFFHSRMVKIMRVVSSFSNMDLETGLNKKDMVVQIYKLRSLRNNIYYTTNRQIRLDINKKIISVGKKNLPLKDIHIVNKNIRKIKTIHINSQYHALVFKNKYIILCNNKVFNSFFIQAMVLDNQNKQLFELINKGNEIKILKLIN